MAQDGTAGARVVGVTMYARERRCARHPEHVQIQPTPTVIVTDVSAHIASTVVGLSFDLRRMRDIHTPVPPRLGFTIDADDMLIRVGIAYCPAAEAVDELRRRIACLPPTLL